VSERTRVAILGSTGSIGRQAVQVVKDHPERFQVVGLCAHTDGERVEEQARALHVGRTGLGAEAAVDLATLNEADVVLNAIVGAAGLRASVAALDAGKTLALANKESLVAGGEACLAAARRSGGRIVPVDSEHAAISQCLGGSDPATIRRIVLTASGGPFRRRPELGEVTPEEALRHPTWSMGPKITIDSATLMNKGLEVIEAHHLFGVGYDAIDVVVHPQSLVHGIVEFVDGTMLMQAAPTDMSIPIQSALSSPSRLSSDAGRLDLVSTGDLEFEQVDHDRFPAMALAYEAGRRARSYPAVLNAANEVAVHGFLGGALRFPEIAATVEAVMSAHDPVDVDDVGAVLEVDAWARNEAQRTVRDFQDAETVRP
jgi:1-deoxy-D-xylulose-5-phosphate reductoisomerase